MDEGRARKTGSLSRSGTLSNRVLHLFSLSCPENGSRLGGDKGKEKEKKLMRAKTGCLAAFPINR